MLTTAAVDAAYAGAALVCPEHQEAVGVGHLAAFDSFNVNMHKWLLTNFDASCAFVADRRPLVAALGGHELSVYRNAFTDGGLVTDYRDWQLALGRRFRALKIWFVLRAHGRAGLQAYIRRTVRAGEAFAAALRARPVLFEVLPGLRADRLPRQGPRRGGAQRPHPRPLRPPQRRRQDVGHRHAAGRQGRDPLPDGEPADHGGARRQGRGRDRGDDRGDSGGGLARH